MTDNAQTINMQDNRTVVGLLRAGDEKCFDALFRRYYKPLCTYATRFVTPKIFFLRFACQEITVDIALFR